MGIFINRLSIHSIMRSGRFTEARQRIENGSASPSKRDFSNLSCWELICEEVLDTDHDPEMYDALYLELLKRGFSHDEVNTMRKLAWRTAGWLNYDRMLWEWVSLDEEDMRIATKQRYKYWFSRKQRDKDLEMIEYFLQRDTTTDP